MKPSADVKPLPLFTNLIRSKNSAFPFLSLERINFENNSCQLHFPPKPDTRPAPQVRLYNKSSSISKYAKRFRSDIGTFSNIP